MRINSIYISAFGGIKNLKIDIKDGFNIIYGDNEQGKTTVMSFIKMMFYGSERGSAQISKNIRKKYTPWDGSSMAGSIDFEHGGKRYRLEKEFRSSNSTDKATLCDLDFGTRQAVGSDIGVKFFGLSAAAFERSVFIGQFGFPENDSAAEGEINSKLSNIALTGEESVSFDAVNGRLQKAKLALMSKSGRAGEYDKNIKLCTELKERIEKATAVGVDYSNKKAHIIALEQEIAQMLKTAQELKAQIDAEQDVRNAEKLAQYLELKAQLDALNETLRLSGGEILDEMYLGKIKFCISKVETAQQKTNAKRSEIQTLKKSIDAGLNPPKDANPETAERIKDAVSVLESKKEKNSNAIAALKISLGECEAHSSSKTKSMIFLIIGIFCVALAVGLLVFVKRLLPVVVLAAVGAVFIGAFAVTKNVTARVKKAAAMIKSQIEALETENNGISQQIFDKKVRLEAITAALNSSAAVIENQCNMLKTAEAELEALKVAEAEETKALVVLFSGYKACESVDEIINLLDELSQKTAKQKEIKQQLNFVSKDLGGISYEDARRKLDEIGKTDINTQVDFSALKARYEKLISEAGEKRSQIAALSAEMKASLTNAENPEELKKQFKAVAEKAAAQKEFCDVADIAMSVLSESFAEVRRSYGSVLEKSAGEIFAGLTNEKYGSMSISKSFDINVSETDAFGSREIDYLSSGTADQAYLALRLALSALICQNGENLPLLLDDALAQYDDTRMKSALEFLKEYSKSSQIVMFTCHNAISTAAQNLGAECVLIR